MKAFTERILTLCDAARTLERALTVLHRRIREQAEREPTNQALQYINSISRPAGIVDYLAVKEGSREYHELVQSIRDEEQHFNLTTQGINRRSLAYQRRKRQNRPQRGEYQAAFEAEIGEPSIATVDPNLMTMSRLEKVPDTERDFIARYRTITTVAPTQNEIKKYLSAPEDFTWPDGPSSAKAEREAEREFFQNYEPDDP